MKSGRALPSLFLLAACYSYRSVDQVETAAPEPGKRIEVRLTEQGSRNLVSQLGPEAQTLDADLIGTDAAAITVAVWRVEDRRHAQTEWRGERVSIPRDAIATVRERRLSLAGTGILGGLIVGGAFAAYEAFKGGGELVGQGPGSGPGPGQQ